MRAWAAVFLFACVSMLAVPVAAQDLRSSNWSEVKCARYTKDWKEALARWGQKGLGADFLAAHEAFLASGCTRRADVCPRSREELALANVLVIRAMNAGAASTFLPFACRGPSATPP